MKKWDWTLTLFCGLLIFFWAFYIGYCAGKDVTTFTFEGLPEDAVVHMEINKGGIYEEDTH